MSEKLSPEVKLALLILEELALRGGQCKLKFLKSYRYIMFWLGEKYSKYILDKLVQGKYVSVEDGKIRLLVKLTVNKSLNQVIKEVDKLVREVYLSRQQVIK